MEAMRNRPSSSAPEPDTEEAPTEKAARQGARPGWGQVLLSLAYLQIARAAQRVQERREHQVEAGRRGGEVSAATRAAPAVPKPPKVAPAKPEEKAAAKTAEEAPTGIWGITKTVFQEFGADNGSLMAAAAAFYNFLSIVPLVLVGIAVLGFFLNDEQARGRTLDFLQQFVAGKQGRELIADVVSGVNKARGWAAITGLVGLVFTAAGGFATLETAINVIWGTPSRNFIMNKVFAVGMTLVIGVLFLLSFAMTFAAATVAEWAKVIPVLGPWASNWGVRLVGLALPIAISGIMFTLIYKFFPTVKVEWKPALIAGFLTSVLWEAFKIGYAFYSSHTNQGAAYGTLAGLVGFIMWVYYSCVLMLLGSELTWVLAGRPRRETKRRM